VTSNSQHLLRLNVGFIIHESVGYSRDFPFEFPSITLKPDLELQNLSGTVRVTRTQQGLLVQVMMTAATDCECVRCLDEFFQPLKINFVELYAFTPHSQTDSGLMVPETGLLDLEPLVREEMLLAIPINPICRADCKGLCPICGGNLNETLCSHEGEEVDPRLSILKTWLNKNG
jgi:uncharacterized protein